MYRIILAIALASITLPSFSASIESSYILDGDDKYRVTQTDKVEMWSNTNEVTGNIKSKQYAKFSGYNELTKTYQDYTVELSDYDTYIVDSYMKDGKYFVKDNLGRVFETGGQGLTSAQVQTLQQVDVNTTNIQKNTQAIQQNSRDINRLGERVNDLSDRMEAGLATVTALTSLHPNPRATGRTQIAIGSGMYRDNVAGAVGLFHHINDDIMLSGGIAYGGSSEWAGNVGLTFSLGRKDKKNDR